MVLEGVRSYSWNNKPFSITHHSVRDFIREHESLNGDTRPEKFLEMVFLHLDHAGKIELGEIVDPYDVWFCVDDRPFVWYECEIHTKTYRKWLNENDGGWPYLKLNNLG